MLFGVLGAPVGRASTDSLSPLPWKDAIAASDDTDAEFARLLDAAGVATAASAIIKMLTREMLSSTVNT